jgi:farnesyl-diphosphate farnesyltransferase
MTRSNTAALETPSGKGRHDENFPVGSWLIRRDLRIHVRAFYRFARAADDIADNPGLAAADKVVRLARMAAVLEGAPGHDSPAATAMRASLAATRLPPTHCLDLLRAFTRDATKLRYTDWDDLIDYCRYSAMPVGRQVLDLHGEPRAAWPPNDALCAALQVLNHLQDCVDDHRNLDRVYLPEQILAAHGASIADLERPRAAAALRQSLDELLDRTDALIAIADGLPATVVDWRLRAETATIVGLARRLSGRLRRGDPVAGRVKLLGVDFGAALCVGLWRSAVSMPRAVPAHD